MQQQIEKLSNPSLIPGVDDLDFGRLVISNKCILASNKLTENVYRIEFFFADLYLFGLIYTS